MDIVEAERNLNKCRNNIYHLTSINTDGMAYVKKEFISGLIREQKSLEKNIEQAIYKQAKKH